MQVNIHVQMKLINTIICLLDKVFLPIKKNALFFVFMYALGILVSFQELPDKNPYDAIYENLWLELFLDLYIICFVLTLIPKYIRPWIRLIFYAIAYTTALADLFCWEKFQTMINPSMLLLVGETDGREASEFVNSYITSDLLLSSIGLAILLMLFNIVIANRKYFTKYLPRLSKLPIPFKTSIAKYTFPILGLSTIVLLYFSKEKTYHNKEEMVQMFSLKTIGAVEHELTTKDCAQFYQPVYRLAFSIFSNELASKQIDRLIEAKDKIQVDSCSYTSPNIVLIIGESYGKHHSQQYGYFMPTTPRQIKLERSGYLTPFTDVVSPWNLTSFVFKNVFSLHVVGEKGEWCDYPLFPELFRKAGYHVTFITNQFLPKAKEAVYDFSGGFFLNHPELSEAMFDTRNKQLYRYDQGLLNEYDKRLKETNKENNLIIFHLIGQHVSYKQRYPKDRQHFTKNDYKSFRPDLSEQRQEMLSNYDNAVLYNDSIVDQIVKRFKKQDAIVIYMPDHGEECYEGNRGFICRNHSAAIDYDLAKYEFEIPFWIYCSPTYAKRHPEIFKQIKRARKKKFMTDALPHLLLYLAGIHTKDYHSQYNILSPNYNENRPRLLKNTTDYNQLVIEHKQQIENKKNEKSITK